jgi:CBS domain-containing protein
MKTAVESVLQSKGSEELVSLPASATVADAVDLMAEKEIGAVVIVTEDGLVDGIFTERDLVTRVVKARRDPLTTTLSMVLTRDVHFVTPGTTVEAALSLMFVQHYRHLLVMDGPRMHGLISMRDLVYHLIRHGEGRLEAAVRQAKADAPES